MLLRARQSIPRPGAYGIAVETLPVEEMSEALRIFDNDRRVIQLSEALDFQNRTFQLAHVICHLWNCLM